MSNHKIINANIDRLSPKINIHKPSSRIINNHSTALRVNINKHNGINKLNTHFYDGKLGSAVQGYAQEISHVSQLLSATKINAFRTLQRELREMNSSPMAQQVLSILINDYSSQGRASRSNYDPTNDLYVDDLLYMCYSRFQIYRRDFLTVLATQLEEMRGGMCPQGRATRLFQTVCSFD